MTNPNDPALPESKITEFNSGLALTTMGGLTKREYFAAMALQGVAIWDALVHEHHLELSGHPENIAKGCVALADALIAELNK